MKTNVVQTVSWSESKALANVFASEYVGISLQREPTDFVSFTRVFPSDKFSELGIFFRNIMEQNTLLDVSNVVLAKENDCLFSVAPASVLEIVFRYLTLLSTNAEACAEWCLFDDEKRAVVHFVKHDEWCVEIFCESSEDSSALHIFELGGKLRIAPVVFCTDISEQIAKAENAGGNVLQTYLPRETYSFLSKKGGKRLAPEKEVKTSAYPYDNDDLL